MTAGRIRTFCTLFASLGLVVVVMLMAAELCFNLGMTKNLLSNPLLNINLITGPLIILAGFIFLVYQILFFFKKASCEDISFMTKVVIVCLLLTLPFANSPSGWVNGIAIFLLLYLIEVKLVERRIGG